MPNRLRSLRGRPAGSTTKVVDPPEYFDFDFRSGQSVFVFPRPSTATGFRTARPSATETRPNTADRPVNRHLNTARSGHDRIGLAIGSPTQASSGWADQQSPISPQHAFRHKGPFPDDGPPPQKNASSTFRPRESSLRKITSPSISNGSAQISRGKLTEQGQPIANGSSRTEKRRPVPPPKEGSSPQNNKSAPPQASQTGLPKLEIEIPRFEFERYSVMFGDIMGSTSKESTLRRTKALQDLKRPHQLSAYVGPSLPSPRRMTDPSETEKPSFLAISNHPLKQNPNLTMTEFATRRRSASLPGPRVTKAAENVTRQESGVKAISSATPPTPPKLAVHRIENGKPQVKSIQIAELSSTKSPVPETKPSFDVPPATRKTHRRTETANSAKPKPLVTRRMPSTECQSSPEEECVGGKENAPWHLAESATSSASSQTSIEEDIFFDLKPFKDSSGVRDSQYVVTKPDAEAVELARSISLKNKQRRKESGSTLEEKSYNWTPEMIPGPWGLPPDLQAAEHFCMSSDMQVAQPVLRLSMFDAAIQEVEKLASPFEHKKPPEPHSVDRISAHTQPPSKGKGLAIGIPSPIAERSCEGTPIVDVAPKMQMPKRHIASLAATSSPTIIVSSTFDAPPPVPRKDSKFLRVMSKSQNPRPVARMDKLASHSTTVPRNPIPPSQFREKQKGNGPRRRHVQDQNMTIVRPRAEVSVARTISLTRKPSYKVVVKRPGGGDGRLVLGVGA